MSKRINNYNTISTSPSIQISNTNTIGNLFTTGGNVGINTISPSFTLDVNGTARITSSLTTGTLNSTSLTSSNIVGTNISSGTISATSMTIPNVVFTNISTSSLRSTDLFLSGTLTTVNITTQNLLISTGTLIANSSTLGSLLVSGDSFNASFNSNTLGSLFTTNGNVGLGTTTPVGTFNINSSDTRGSITLNNNLTNKKIVLHGSSVNDQHTYFGFGINAGSLRYQTGTSSDDHVFYAGISSTTSNELLRIKGTGNVIIQGGMTVSSLLVSTGTLLIQNRISSLGYQYSVNSTNGSNSTTNLGVINKRIKSSRAIATNCVSTWIYRTSNLACQGICWSPELNLFAATNYNAGAATTSAIQTSPDGINWTTRTTPNITTLSYITWSSELNLFAATSYQAGTSSIITSPDGINWTQRTTPAFTGNGWQGICYSPELGLFVVVLGSATVNTSWVMTSSNGTTWTGQTTPSSSGWNGVCWAAELNLFVACTAVTSTNCIATSPNGINWTLQTTPNIGIYCIKWSAELGLLVGITVNSCITSPDGITWTTRTVPTGTWIELVWSQELSLFVACQTTIGTSAIMTSHNGINWVARTTPSTQLWGVCYSPELSIFIGVNPFSTTLITSNYGLPSNQNTISAVRSQMTVTSSGNVGIGTTTPTNILDVNGNIGMYNGSNAIDVLYYMNNQTTNFWRIGSDGASSTAPFHIYNNSFVGVFLVYGATAWSANSDIRIKKNVVNMTSGISLISQLNPVNYNYKTDTIQCKTRVGFIAQEVQQVLPDLVSSRITEEYPDGLSMTEMIPYLVNSIKELNNKLTLVQNELNTLKNT